MQTVSGMPKLARRVMGNVGDVILFAKAHREFFGLNTSPFCEVAKKVLLDSEALQ